MKSIYLTKSIIDFINDLIYRLGANAISMHNSMQVEHLELRVDDHAIVDVHELVAGSESLLVHPVFDRRREMVACTRPPAIREVGSDFDSNK